MSDRRCLPAVGSVEFQVLGNRAVIHTPATARVVDAVKVLVLTYEARFTGFWPDSEVSRLSARAGVPSPVTPELFDLLALAQRLWCDTGGLFDPLVAGRGWGGDGSASSLTSNFGEVRLDAPSLTAMLPAGSRVDLGALGRAWVTDRTAAFLARHGPFLVDIDGDVRADATGAAGIGWSVRVPDPSATAREISRITLRGEAAATFAIARGGRNGGMRRSHRLLDPRTGRLPKTDLVQASVLGRTAVEADVQARTAVLLGSSGALAWLERRGLPGLLLTADGRQLRTRRWRERERSTGDEAAIAAGRRPSTFSATGGNRL